MNANNNESHFTVINPATGDVVDTCRNCSDEELENAVTAANQAFKSWSKTTDEVRSNVLNKMADFVEKKSTKLARLLTLEQGKQLKGLVAEFEVSIVCDWLRATAAMKLEDKLLENNGESPAILVRKSVGVVASITPWNWPLMIATWHIAPAIRVGWQ
jgi:acyl-CoA reductase-like NAD-dependent aldehyde dehydrogenase